MDARLDSDNPAFRWHATVLLRVQTWPSTVTSSSQTPPLAKEVCTTSKHVNPWKNKNTVMGPDRTRNQGCAGESQEQFTRPISSSQNLLQFMHLTLSTGTPRTEMQSDSFLIQNE
jgi:hypothetical protein